MTLRSGTSKSGKVFRYYSCSTKRRQGDAGCRGRSIPMNRLDELVAEFGTLIRRNVTEGPVPFRKAWLRSIEVDADTVRIVSDKANLEQVIAAANTGPLQEPGVRSSVRKWRGLRESNPSSQRERLVS